MRHIRSLLFIGILSLLAYLIYYIIGKDLSDTNNVSFDINDEKIVNSAIDSISHIENVMDTMSIILPVYATQVEDFEAKADINTDFIHFQIFKIVLELTHQCESLVNFLHKCRIEPCF